MAKKPSISLTTGVSLFKIECTKLLSSALMALPSSITGFSIEIVLVPWCVSISKEKVSGSSGFFNLIISVFFSKKSIPI